MPVGLQAQHEAQQQDQGHDKSEAQLRREAATAQLHAESAAEANGDENEGSLSGTTARDDDDGVEEARAAAVHTAEAEA